MRLSFVLFPITLALAIVAWVYLGKLEAVADVGYCTAVVPTQRWIDKDRVGECSRVFTKRGIVLRAKAESGKAYLPDVTVNIDQIDLQMVYKVLIENDTSGEFARKVPSFEKWWEGLPTR